MKLLRYFKGYIEIYATGFFLERFLNLCLKENIFLWDLNRKSFEELTAKISISDFKNLPRSARKTRTKIKIGKKYGFPFFVHKHRRRRGIIPSILLFIIILWYFSTHLMGVSIEGTAVPSEKINSHLASYGIKIGMPVKNINNKILKNQLMTSIEDFGWVGVNLKGSRLYITASDREKPKSAIASELPCNIVASKDGVVRLMEIRDGQTMVLVNTPVKKGDLLVSGVIDSNKVGMRYTHSYGEVWAETVTREEIEIPLKYTQKVMTKRAKTKYTLSLLNFSLRLYLRENPPFEKYVVYENNREFTPLLEIFPSVFVHKKKYFEQSEKVKTRSIAEAVVLGRFQLLHKINSTLSEGAIIEDVAVGCKKQGEKVLVTLTLKARENIAEQTLIDKTEDLDYNN